MLFWLGVVDHLTRKCQVKIILGKGMERGEYVMGWGEFIRGVYEGVHRGVGEGSLRGELAKGVYRGVYEGSWWGELTRGVHRGVYEGVTGGGGEGSLQEFTRGILSQNIIWAFLYHTCFRYTFITIKSSGGWVQFSLALARSKTCWEHGQSTVHQPQLLPTDAVR